MHTLRLIQPRDPPDFNAQMEREIASMETRDAHYGTEYLRVKAGEIRAKWEGKRRYYEARVRGFVTKWENGQRKFVIDDYQCDSDLYRVLSNLRKIIEDGGHTWEETFDKRIVNDYMEGTIGKCDRIITIHYEERGE